MRDSGDDIARMRWALEQLRLGAHRTGQDGAECPDEDGRCTCGWVEINALVDFGIDGEFGLSDYLETLRAAAAEFRADEVSATIARLVKEAASEPDPRQREARLLAIQDLRNRVERIRALHPHWLWAPLPWETVQ